MVQARSVVLGAVPGVTLALIMVIAVPGAAITGAQITTDNVGPQGYVTVSVVREGHEIYRHEGNNAITNDGKALIASRIFDPADTATLSGTNKALYIALAATDQVVDAEQTSLTTEITTNGLERSLGDFSFNSSTGVVTITNTFTAEDDFTDVRRAGLFNDESAGTMFAINSFTAVTLAENDQLTITWTITLA